MKSLYLFGSAATDNYVPGKSDLDFVVDFAEDLNPIDFADNYFSLRESLKALFQTEVDLLSYRALKNEVMVREIERTKVALYAA